MKIKDHVCEYRPVCTCGAYADSPNEDCPIHMSLEYRKTCTTCGRFVKNEKVKK